MNLDLETTRRQLIARRVAAGADTEEGQTLPWMIQQQMKRLAPRIAQ